MKRCHLPIILALTAVVGLAVGCTKRPDQPGFDNPFDPEGPDAGSPIGVHPAVSGNTVIVSWNQPAHPDIVEYVVLHSLDEVTFANVGTVDHKAGQANNSFVHDAPVPNVRNFYKVRARNSAGATSAVSRAVAAQQLTPPRLLIDKTGNTPTRHVNLSILTQVGEFVVLANNEGFADSVELAADPGDTMPVAWDLGPAAANGENKTVYLMVLTGDDSSLVNQKSIQTRFSPGLDIDGGRNVVHQLVTLTVSGDGIDSMRFAASESELETAAWVPGDSLFTSYELTTNPNPQPVHAEFLSDFGYSIRSQVTATPADLSGAGFTVRSLSGDPDVTGSNVVAIHSDVTAAEMRFTESPSFVGVPWRTFADSTSIPLSPAEGLKVIYGQYRHVWAESPPASDWIVLVTRPVDVGFVFPVNGGVVLGGSQVTVEGFAAAGGDSALKAVQVNLGEGAYVAAAGLQEWSAVWDVPLLAQDTEWVLGARAIAGLDTTTTLITVTITQLAVAITVPEDGAVIPGGAVSTVSGTASAPLGGPPLDAIVVNLAGSDTTLAGAQEWSVDWDVPGVTGDLATLITATAWADGESVSDTVGVTITP